MPLRLFFGLAFLAHGAQKLFGVFGGGLGTTARSFADFGVPASFTVALLIALLELVGGGLLILGLATRAAAALLALEMIVATFLVHWPHGFFAQNGGVELPLAYLAGMLALVIAGAGPVSVDAYARRFAERARPRRFGVPT